MSTLHQHRIDVILTIESPVKSRRASSQPLSLALLLISSIQVTFHQSWAIPSSSKKATPQKRVATEHVQKRSLNRSSIQTTVQVPRSRATHLRAQSLMCQAAPVNILGMSLRLLMTCHCSKHRNQNRYRRKRRQPFENLQKRPSKQL